MTTVLELVRSSAKSDPDALAILAPGRAPLTCAGLVRQIQEIGAWLNDWGIGRGDRVATILPDGPEMAVAFLGIAATAICAPLNPAYRASEFDRYLSGLGLKAVVLPADLDSPARDVAREHALPILELSPLTEAPAGSFRLVGARVGGKAAAEPAGPEDIALLLHTSGTTGRRKIVLLTHANLCGSARNVAHSLGLSADDRCLCIVPLFHIHGLVAGVLASLAAGGGVICPPGFLAPQFSSWLRELRPTWYTAVPSVHQAIVARLARHPGEVVGSALRLIRSCSAPMSPRLMQELEETFGVPVIQAYGMTEASHQISSNPLPPCPRKPGSVGLPAGVEVVILNEAGDSLPPGEVGEVAIRGPNVIWSDENAPSASMGASSMGWLRTGDQGRLDADGYLFLSGRIKEIINRGGEKISPWEVEEALLTHPGVAQAVAFALPHPVLGETVAAAVVLNQRAAASESDLRRFAAKCLADFKVPERVVIVPEIPTGPTGKLERVGLGERLALGPVMEPGPNPRPEYLAPRTPFEVRLLQIWQAVLGVSGIGVLDDFFQLGGDSLLATRVLTRIREVFQVDLSIVDFFDLPTIAGQAVLLLQVRAEELPPEEVLRLVAEVEGLSEASR